MHRFLRPASVPKPRGSRVNNCGSYFDSLERTRGEKNSLDLRRGNAIGTRVWNQNGVVYTYRSQNGTADAKSKRVRRTEKFADLSVTSFAEVDFLRKLVGDRTVIPRRCRRTFRNKSNVGTHDANNRATSQFTAPFALAAARARRIATNKFNNRRDKENLQRAKTSTENRLSSTTGERG